MYVLDSKRSGRASITIVMVGLVISACAPSAPTDERATDSAGAKEEVALKGRWNVSTSQPDIAAKQAEMIEQLEAMGYSQGTMEAGELSGVALNNEDATMPGYNLYNSGHDISAILMDMAGNTLHEWSLPYEDAFGVPATTTNDNCFFWRRVLLLPGGDLLAIHEGLGLVRVDKDSNRVWGIRNGAHHDMALIDDESLFVLTRRTYVKDSINEIWPLTEDFVSRVSLDGEPVDSFSIIDAFENSPYADIWHRTLATYDFGATLVDTMHTNTLNILDGAHVDSHPGFKKGNLLISSLEMSAMFTINPTTQQVEWAWQGGWHGIHEPTLLENGDILFYLNSAFKFGRVAHSRVLQVNPITKATTWSFGDTDPLKSFISPFCGTATRLSNGNTLVVASESGRAMEVAHSGEIVWDFYSPHRTGSNNELVGTLFHVERIPIDTPLDWLED